MKLWMLCWNRVSDYARWRTVFDADREAHRRAGLTLEWVRRDHRDPDHIHFLFRVESHALAEAFIADPASVDAGERAGVIEGDYGYITEVE